MTTVASFLVDARKAKRKIETVKRELGSRQILQAVANDQLRWINKNFLAAGLERKWEPLAESTVFARRKSSNRPLLDSGRLRASFVRGRRDNIYIQPLTNQIVVGSNVKYAEFHEQGTAPYVIVPTNKKALAFPHPAGTSTLKGIKARRFRGKSGFVVPFVDHPGLPQRKMLPSQRLAERMAVKTLDKVFNAIIRKADRG